MIPPRHFASDNWAGIHPDVFKALSSANQGHAPAYGGDPWTGLALAKFREHFGRDTEAFLVFLGTGANVLGLKAVTEPHHAVLCAETAHLHADECGAPERFTGCKLLTLPTSDGKITPAQVEGCLRQDHPPHQVVPRVLSITQATEFGTVYTPAEIRALADLAHAHGLLIHMDGARLANAAVSLGVGLKETTRDAGVDVLSFGGTKNGLMLGEAVLFFDKALAKDFAFIRKQGMQLASKMRFIAAQFEALLSNDLWRRNAGHANRMASRLAEGLSPLPGVRITQPVQANAVFAVLPKGAIPRLQQHASFHVWDERTGEVRLMTAFDTTEEDIAGLVQAAGEILRARPS
jgi:threonine aldolase